MEEIFQQLMTDIKPQIYKSQKITISVNYYN